MSMIKFAIVIGVCVLVVMGCATSPTPAPPEKPKAADDAETPAPPPEVRPEEPEVKAPEAVPPPADIPPEKEEPAAPPPADEAPEETGKPEEPADENENTDPVAAPPPVPAVADDDMEITASVTFEEPDAATLCTTDSGEGLGLKWSIADGAGRFSGTTVPSAPGTWLSNSFQFPVGIDFRTKLEISGEIRIAHSDGLHVIALWAPGHHAANRLCIYYAGRPGRGNYVIQTHWMNIETTTTGKRAIPAFGDEKDAFHQMRMLLDRGRKKVDYYVDDIHLGTVSYEGEIDPITSVGMDIETPNGGTKMDIRYDNIKVRSSGPLY